MAGFRHVVSNAVATAIDDGPTLPLAPLPLYALLKLVAFDDRNWLVNLRPSPRRP
jgi:predicted nucleotidyltransferase